MLIVLGVILLVVISFILKGIQVVPQQQAWLVQRLGKFDRKIEAGMHWITPIVDKISYKHSLKEDAVDIHEQTAITQDNVSVKLDGILYLKIVDPVAASYGVENPHYALTQLAQTTMRSEIGKIPLDKTFEEREALNHKIVNAINEAATSWGIQCMRYEIKDITMPDVIRKAMELQMTAERQKRARILESEGMRQSQINESEGLRQAEINRAEAMRQKVVLESEASQIDQVNRAKGEAEAILAVAEATAKGIEFVATAIQKNEGEKAVALRVAEQYIEAFKQIAQKGTTVLLPAQVGDAGAMVAQALSIFDTLKAKQAAHVLSELSATNGKKIQTNH